LNFKKLKINSVILKNRNHDEVIDLVRFAVDRKIDISFIEEMPLGIVSEHNRNESYYSSDQIKNDLKNKYELVSSAISTGGPSKYYKIIGTNTKVGFISPHSHNFCGQCNRVRLTAEGQLLLCLGQEHSVNLKKIIRTFPGDIEKLKHSIKNAMQIKPKGHEFDLNEKPVIFRHMNVTGG
jgi:cyclic pyranopterin phosphate synthase